MSAVINFTDDVRPRGRRDKAEIYLDTSFGIDRVVIDVEKPGAQNDDGTIGVSNKVEIPLFALKDVVLGLADHLSPEALAEAISALTEKAELQAGPSIAPR